MMFLKSARAIDFGKKVGKQIYKNVPKNKRNVRHWTDTHARGRSIWYHRWTCVELSDKKAINFLYSCPIVKPYKDLAAPEWLCVISGKIEEGMAMGLHPKMTVKTVKSLYCVPGKKMKPDPCCVVVNEIHE